VEGPQAKREAVPVAHEEGQLSERRACGLMGMYELLKLNATGIAVLSKRLISRITVHIK
jgi:hypothetical protein